MSTSKERVYNSFPCLSNCTAQQMREVANTPVSGTHKRCTHATALSKGISLVIGTACDRVICAGLFRVDLKFIGELPDDAFDV